MGKIARSVAWVHEFTTEPVTDGVKFLGRKVRSGVVSAKTAISTEHADIEATREAKKEARAAAEEAVEEIIATTKAAKQAAKPAKVKKVTVTTEA